MAAKSIPQDIRKQVEEIVARFNRQVVRAPGRFYSARYRGKYLYLDRNDYGRVGPRCRLEYTGDMNAWEFAIYKYSDECYDPEDWFFPGGGYVDGTVEGALKAASEAYP
jgi:hypothetical protein